MIGGICRCLEIFKNSFFEQGMCYFCIVLHYLCFSKKLKQWAKNPDTWGGCFSAHMKGKPPGKRDRKFLDLWNLLQGQFQAQLHQQPDYHEKSFWCGSSPGSESLALPHTLLTVHYCFHPVNSSRQIL